MSTVAKPKAPARSRFEAERRLVIRGARWDDYRHPGRQPRRAFSPSRGLRRQRHRDHDQRHGPRTVLLPPAPSHRRGRASTGHRVSSPTVRPHGGNPRSSGASRRTSGTSSTRRKESGSPGSSGVTRRAELRDNSTQGFPQSRPGRRDRHFASRGRPARNLCRPRRGRSLAVRREQLP